MGLSYMAALMSINLCFDEKRTLVWSITRFGGSVGMFLFSWMYGIFDLKNTMFVISSLMSLCALLSFTLETPDGETQKAKYTSLEDYPKEKSLQDSIVEYFNWKKLWNTGLCFYLMGRSFSLLAMVVSSLLLCSFSCHVLHP